MLILELFRAMDFASVLRMLYLYLEVKNQLIYGFFLHKVLCSFMLRNYYAQLNLHLKSALQSALLAIGL